MQSTRADVAEFSMWIAKGIWRENRCVGLIAGWGWGLVGYKFRHFSFYHFTARGSTSCMSAQRRTYVRSRGRCPVSAVDRPPSLSHSRSHSPPCTRLPPCSLLAARVHVAGPALSVSPHARTAIRTNKIVCAVCVAVGMTCSPVLHGGRRRRRTLGPLRAAAAADVISALRARVVRRVRVHKVHA
jgi:hypothetical protein